MPAFKESPSKTKFLVLTESLLNSATPWKPNNGKTSKQNIDSSKLPHFDVIQMTSGEKMST